MKAFQVLLVLCLFASLECEDIISQVSCFISQPDMLPSIKQIYEMIKSKENGIMIGLQIVAMYDKIVKAVNTCFK